MKQITFAILVAAALATSANPAPIPSVTLLPSNGSVAGNPGSVVGWGFTLTYNAPSDWVVLTGSEFTGSPVYGTYVDYLSLSNAPLYLAGPAPESSVITQPWISSSNPPLGLGEFDINSTAPGGTHISGDILIHYSVFSQDPNDPNFDPDTSTVVADATLSNPVGVNVSPEPASVVTVSAALSLCALARLRSAARAANSGGSLT